MTIDLKATLIAALPKDLCIDLDDRVTAEAIKAFKMVRDHSGLDVKRGRALEGQARFRMMEKGFQEVCETHGGVILQNGIVPGTDLKVYQPFMRFEAKGTGIILGLAAMPEPSTLPYKNKSRIAGASLNYSITPRLDFDGTGPKIGDFFALFLIARDRTKGGRIEEIAIGVIDSEYENFLHYETLTSFMAGYVEDSNDVNEARLSIPKLKKTGVTLKKKVEKFVPPEEVEIQKPQEN